MQYLPDTNIFIKAAKGYLPESQFLSNAIEKRQIMISVVVAGEFFAKAGPEEEKSFEGLLAKFEILSIDIEVARMAAVYRKKSLKSSKVHMLDCFLAAQAKLYDLTLVTNNKSDFPMKDIKVISPRV